MKEYTLAATVAALASLLLDRALATRLSSTARFWIFQGLMIPAQLLVNGYLTARPIVLYGADHFLGIRVITIPVEDFIYGFSLLTFSLVLWEFFKRKEGVKRSA